MLDFANKLQQNYGNNYKNLIEYAYKLLLQNQAHDGICGCSTDDVHSENITRYKKILQISNTIIEELRLKYGFKTPIMNSPEILEGYEVEQKIPITEDFTTIYTQRKAPKSLVDIDLRVENGQLFANEVRIDFTRCDDLGDTYNFAPKADDYGEIAKVFDIKGDTIFTEFFEVKFFKTENLLNFKIKWDNRLKNKLWQVKFVLKNPVTKTFSEDLNTIIEREFDPNYDLRKN